MFFLLYASFLVCMGDIGVATAADPVGIFLSDIKGCSFTSGGDTDPCMKGAFIFPGDSIKSVEGAKKLPIQWLAEDAISFEKGKSGEKIVIKSHPVQGKSALNGIFSFFRARSSVTKIGASRGPFESGPITILSDRPVRFDWCDISAEKLLVLDGAGKEVYSLKIAGFTSAEIDPKNLKLERGGRYLWSVTGIEGFRPQPLILLPEAEEQEILAALASVGEGLLKSEALLRRATYMAYRTDLAPSRTNFNWMINRDLTTTIEKLDEEGQKLARLLIHNSGYERCY